MRVTDGCLSKRSTIISSLQTSWGNPIIIGCFSHYAQMSAMMWDLETSKEFGFDVEAHNARTYHGLTCLLQISTATKVRWLF